MTETLIKLRRSAVPGKIPADAQLQLGEVAINTYDGKMFFKQAATSNTILQVATTSLNLGQFASTTSAQLASIISNETGIGSLVFNTSPTLVTPVISGNTTFDSGTLFVDSVTNRVGIGISSPTEKLHVEGNARALSFASANGSASAPAYDFAADTNTGIFLPAVDTIGFATNGTTAAQFTSSGNLRLFNTAGTRYTEISTQPTSNNTLTLPSSGDITLVSGTMATADTAQVISGSKTFTSSPAVSGSYPAFYLLESDTVDLNTEFVNNNGGLFIRTINDTLSTANTRIFVNHTDGNVGIGTSLPSAKIDVDGGILGSALNDVSQIAKFRVFSTNTDSLVFKGVRKAAGSDWTTAAHRIERVVDVTAMGYIQFGASYAQAGDDLITFGEGASEYLRIDGSGKVGIGTIAPSTLLHVNGEITAVNYNTTSDINVKKNVCIIEDALSKVLQLNGVTFSFIDDPDEQRHAGVIAQDVEKVLPEAVKELGSGVKHVAYGNLIGLLVEAIKDQQKQIDELKALINK